MRRLAAIALCLAVASCGSAGAVDKSPPVAAKAPVAAPAPKTTTTQVATTTTAAASTSTAPLELTAESLPEGASLVLAAREAVGVFSSPDHAAPFRTLEPTTILGTTTVVTVLEGPEGGWARVMLPGRPNGSEGWVRSDEMRGFVVEGRVVVDLSDRTLTYYQGDEVILTTAAAVGTGRNPTPTGTFYVTDNVTLTDPDSVWGPHALGLSARSDTITEYRGADGIIGIHGTNRPGSIGEAASLGCVRVPNEVIAMLHELVEVGTPVEIGA
jgi:lipoprotein-anchoring transpeptidase ErfK/SrfK